MIVKILRNKGEIAMKRKSWVLVMVSLCLLIGLISIVMKPTSQQSSIERFESFLNQERSFVLVIGSETCNYCQIYEEETLDLYDEKEMGYELIHIQLQEFGSDEEINEFIERYELELIGTPTTYFYDNGKLIRNYAGVLNKEELKTLLAEMK